MDNQSSAIPLSGEVDSSFGVNGTVRLTKSGGVVSNVKKAVVDSDGRILLAGTFKTQAAEQYAIIRLNADGEQDPTFGDKGITIGNFIKKEDARANSVTITQDNRLLLSGTSGARKSGGTAETVFMGGIACFDQAGVLDPSFGSQGHITLYIRRPADQKPIGHRAVPDNLSDPVAGVLSSVEKNRILYTWMGPARSIDSGIYLPYAVLGRLNAGGASDDSFQKEGHIYIHYLGGTSVELTRVEGHLVVDGQIIVAGLILYAAAPGRGYLRRYDLNGRLDTTFGGSADTDGFALTPALGERNGEGSIKAFVRLGSTLLLTGNTGEQGVMAAFTLDGAVDQSFNQGQLLYAELPGLPSSKKILWLDAASSDGGILALGYIDAPEFGNFVIARYLSSGVLDARFGAGKGWILSAPELELKAIVVQRRAGGLPNRILVTGVVSKGEYAVVMAFLDV